VCDLKRQLLVCAYISKTDNCVKY